jgi:hypothetical protein
MDKGKFTAKPFVTNAGHNVTGDVYRSSQECFRVASTGLFDYQRAAVQEMTPAERESWIRKDIKLVGKEFNDGVNTYKLKVNQDGWTVESAALKGMAETRKVLDKLKK